MTGGKQGGPMRGGDLIDMCIDADAARCLAFIAADAIRAADDLGVVVMVMGTQEGHPVGYMILDCVHDVEMVTDRLRRAAEDAFKDQPCRKCES